MCKLCMDGMKDILICPLHWYAVNELDVSTNRVRNRVLRFLHVHCIMEESWKNQKNVLSWYIMAEPSLNAMKYARNEL